MVHCNAKFEDENRLAKHKSTECLFRPLSCPHEGCTEVFSALHEETHDSECPFKLLPCEQGCKERVTRGDMDRHCVTTCPMKLVSCPFQSVGCKESLHQCEVDAHCDSRTQLHLRMVLQLLQRQDVTIGSYVQRLALVEKSVSLAARAADVDVHTVGLQLKESEAKVRQLSAEVTQLKRDMKATDMSADVLQLRRELKQLHKMLERGED
jgi:homogentisate solanesyltransferase